MGFFLAIWATAIGIGYTSIGAEYSNRTYNEREAARIERMLAKTIPPIVVGKEAGIPWLTEQTEREFKMWVEHHGK